MGSEIYSWEEENQNCSAKIKSTRAASSKDAAVHSTADT
jgi:hypothetical protein